MKSTIIALLYAASLTAADTTLLEGDLGSFVNDRAIRTTVVLVDGADQGGKVLQVRVSEMPEAPWKAQAWTSSISAPIDTGDTLVITLKARCVEPAGDVGKLCILVGQNCPPYQEVATKTIQIGADWKEYTFNAVSSLDIPAGQVRVGFLAGYKVQTIEISSMTAISRRTP
jgi:hypothetical protein